MAARPGHGWPLTGRDAELARAWEALAGPDARSVVLIGEAGIGKSRLASDLCDRAAAAGFRVHRAAASDSSRAIPFGALSPLLPAVVEDADPLALLQRVRAELADQDPGAGLVLWVDDAHLLDPGSATLVAQLVDGGDSRLVATARSGRAAPPAVDQLWRSGRAERIDLEPLPEGAVRTLLAAALGPPVASGTARRLWQRSGGNPLMLRELVRAALHAQTLSDESGVWLLADSDVRSPALLDLVVAHVGELAAGAAEAVELLALADVLSVSALQDLVPGLDLESLEAAGVVDVAADGRRLQVRLAHPLYGEVTRQELGVLQRRRHHGRLVESVTAAGARRRDDVLRVATWSLDTDHPAVPPRLVEAAVQAQWRFDLSLAERLATEAAAVEDGFRVRYVLGELALRRGRLADALEEFAIARELAGTTGDQVEAVTSTAHVLHLMGRPGDAWQAVQQLASTVPAEERAPLDARQALLLVLAGRPAAAIAAAEQVAAEVSQLPDPRRYRLQADYVRSLAGGLLGRLSDVEQVVAASVTALRADPLPHLPAEQTLIGRSVARTLLGDPAGGAADARALERAMVDLGDREGEATAAFLLGLARLAAGRAEEARDQLGRAVALNTELADPLGLRWSRGALANALALLGESADALELLAEVPDLPIGECGLFEPDVVQRGLAWAEVAAGRFDAGRERLRRAADLAASLGQVVPELHLRHDLLRLGATEEQVALQRLTVDVEGRFAEAVARHAAVRGRHPGEGLVAASEALDDAGAVVAAAEAAVAAADAFRREGRPRDAAAADRLAAALAARCPGVRTPGLTRAPAPSPLSSREREIALLAAQQLSAADIAARLHLSRRTVENHLQRIYGKLGISSRTELAEVLRA